ncbi:MAG: hypothetical protein IAI48_03775, partial [Candidatus Eremiobacteraeota bacterium]|nr:hypothetical protein [Candidatus Eremiobacteraeota bacterium]
LLGVAISSAEAAAALRSLGFAVTTDGDAIEAVPPFWRNDVRIAEDLVEEIARVVGYDRIVAAVPAVLEHAVSSAAYRAQSRTAHALAALGYREAFTMSLQSAAVRERYERAGVALAEPVVEIRNPLSEEQRYLRFSLAPALLELAARHAGDAPYRIFEIGDVFAGGDPATESSQAAWLCALPRADEPAWRDSGFTTFKGESLALLRALTGRDAAATATSEAGWHPGKTATLDVDGSCVAVVGAVDPRVLAAFGVEARVYVGRMRFAELPAYRVPRYAAPSKYPALSRDIAIVVAPAVPAADIERAARAGGDGALVDVRVFDEYRGPQVGDDKKSVAVRITLQRPDATLTDAEADAHVDAILTSLRDRCGAAIRA